MIRSEEMKAVLARWRESGLSLRAFCQHEGLSYQKLLYWRRNLRSEQDAPPRISTEADSKTNEQRWAPIRVVTDSQASSASDFEVRLSNGLSLRVPPTFEEGDLRRLVLVLASC